MRPQGLDASDRFDLIFTVFLEIPAARSVAEGAIAIAHARD